MTIPLEKKKGLQEKRGRGAGKQTMAVTLSGETNEGWAGSG